MATFDVVELSATGGLSSGDITFDILELLAYTAEPSEGITFDIIELRATALPMINMVRKDNQWIPYETFRNIDNTWR